MYKLLGALALAVAVSDTAESARCAGVTRPSAQRVLAISQVADARLAAGDGGVASSPSQSAASAPPGGHSAARIANVMDPAYGARCDGASDDSAAFQAALNTGLNVVVPSRAACVVGNLTLSRANQYFTSNGGALIAAPGSNFVVEVSGFEPHMSGFFISEDGRAASQATLAAAAPAGATTVVVDKVRGPKIQPGQRYSVMTATGIFATGFVKGVGDSTVTLSRSLPGPAAAGAWFWSTFGAIHVTNAAAPALDDIRCNATFGCILLDDAGAAGDAQHGVWKGSVNRITTLAGRMFGIVKGRNVHDMTFLNEQLWGGFEQVDTFAGDGTAAAFPLSAFVLLNRELTVRLSIVNSDGSTTTVPQMRGRDYSTDGLRIAFAKPPARGASVVANYWAYGAEGFVDSCEDVGQIACGGNTLSASSALQWNVPIRLQTSQLFRGSTVMSDAGSLACVEIDSASHTTVLDGLSLHWCPTQILAHNAAIGVKILTGSSTLVPATYMTSGLPGVLASVETGSFVDLDWMASSSGSTVSLIGGLPTVYDRSSGAPAVGWGCAPGAILSKVYQWCGSSGILSLNGAGTRLEFSHGGVNSVSASAANATLDLQAGGPHGAVRLDASDAVTIKVGGADDFQCSGQRCAAAIPLQLASYSAAALPPCGSAGAGAMAMVLDLASTPFYGAAITAASGGGAIKWPVICDGDRWMAH